jgi:Xaa-Pro aminopeptidase
VISNRSSLIEQLLQSCELDAVLILDPRNLRYLCGFTGSDGALLVSGRKDRFLTDSRYTTQARSQVAADQVIEYSVKFDGIISNLLEMGVRRVGFEAEAVPFAVVQKLQEKGGQFEWVAVGKEFLALRGIKDAGEVRAMEAAAQINAAAFAEILPLLRPGAVEREVALALEFAMRRRGAEEKAFDLIVASGDRGAMPHGIAAERIIQKGELVTIDFGNRFQGYHSDETVTVAIGEVSSRLRKIFDTALAAHDLAMAAVKPGVPLREIDGIARGHIAARGFGDFFGHGLGHGVGLDIHEFPTLNQRSEEIAREGMVFTIEPGIYIPGTGGVRIEDMVQVTADGCRQLTRISKEFQSLPV